MTDNQYISSSKNLFSGHAQQYSKFRPSHPKDLIEYLKNFCASTELAWDVATGNGQAAHLLADYFDKVVATDLSQSQIDNAVANPKIEFRCESAEDPTSKLIAGNSVDLITVAVALHWIPHEAFYKRVNKVLKPNGIIAAWSYYIPKINPEVDAVHDKYDKLYLKPNDAPELRYIRDGYRNLPWSFQPIENFESDSDGINRSFVIRQQIDLNGYINRISTYSTTQVYIKKFNKDPVQELYPEFLKAWGGDPNQIKEMRDEIFLRVGRKSV